MQKMGNNQLILRVITIAIIVALLFSSVLSVPFTQPKPVMAQPTSSAIIVTIEGLKFENTFLKGDIVEDLDPYTYDAIKNMGLDIPASDIMPFTECPEIWQRDAYSTEQAVKGLRSHTD